MTLGRSTVAALAIGLTLTVGLVGGVVLQQYVHFDTAQRLLERRRARATYDARKRDPKQWASDSVRWAESAQRFKALWRPREVRRIQALNTCAISLEIRDTSWQHAQLVHVGAWDRERPGVIVAEAWDYHDSGFPRGDTVTAVLPNVYCGDLMIATFGAAVVNPQASVQMNVR